VHHVGILYGHPYCVRTYCSIKLYGILTITVMVIVVTESLVTVCHLWLPKNPQYFRGLICMFSGRKRKWNSPL